MTDETDFVPMSEEDRRAKLRQVFNLLDEIDAGLPVPNFDPESSETGENWWWENHNVRLCKNISMGHVKLSEIRPVPGLEPHLSRHGIAQKP